MATPDDALFEAAEFDRALVGRLREGEATAFHELFGRYRKLVYSIAFRLLNDKSDADDICQEVFLAVHRRIGTLREADKLRAWICRITVTRVYNAERSYRRRYRALTVSIDEAGEAIVPSKRPSSDPERALVCTETRRRIHDALARLPFHFRSVVVLRDVEGLTLQEIAEALELNVGTVKSRLSRGREALRKGLSDLLQWHREVGR